MTDSTPPPDLRTRWLPTIGEAVNNQLLRGLPNGSPFGATSSGHADLRGLVIKAFVKSVSLRLIDFTSCEKEWAGQFGFCTVEDCLFVDSVLPTNFGSSFTLCRFSGAKLKGAVLRGQFEKCDFSKADLSSVLGNGVTFQNCDFTGTNMRKGQLTNSR